MRAGLVRLGAVVLLLGVGMTFRCGGGDDFDFYLGQMDSDSYAGQRWRDCGPNGLGEPVRFRDFEGRFLWVDYSALWCGYCTRQAGVVRQLERSLGEKVAFLTVMVDGGEPMTDPTAQTAKEWAQRFGLDERRVVAQRIYVGPVPHHFLYSPDGQLLYRESGLHSAELIQAQIGKQMTRWKRWRNEHRSAVD